MEAEDQDEVEGVTEAVTEKRAKSIIAVEYQLSTSGDGH